MKPTNPSRVIAVVAAYVAKHAWQSHGQGVGIVEFLLPFRPKVHSHVRPGLGRRHPSITPAPRVYLRFRRGAIVIYDHYLVDTRTLGQLDHLHLILVFYFPCFLIRVIKAPAMA